MNSDDRPDPDSLLRAIQRDEAKKKRGQLRIFFGMAAGVGKTSAMLRAAHQQKSEGIDVVIGTIDTHGRKDTQALVEGLAIIPRKKIDYKSTVLEEMDLDGVLERHPQLVLVDELAHCNVPGSRHLKRYQDVLEILDQGIDVYTTINVQHLESRKEAVEQISQISIRETVPDSILETAAQIELIDVSPDELLKRLRDGKVYLGDRAEAAQKNFFKHGPLTALREIALRITAEKVDKELQNYMETTQTQGPWKAAERLMVAVSHSPYSERLIRATRRIAYNLEATWIAVNVNTGVVLGDEDQAQLLKNLTLVRELGGELLATTDIDIPHALRRIARQKNVTQIVVGRPTRRLLRNFIEGGSLLDRLVRESGDFDVHVIRQESAGASRNPWWAAVSIQAKLGDYWRVLLILFCVTVFSGVTEPLLGYKAVGFLFMLGVLGISLFFSVGPVFLGAASSALIWDYFFIPPRLTLHISEKEDILMCAVYFITAMTTGWLTNRIRARERLLAERDERMTLLYEIVSDIVKASGRSDFVDAICARVGKALAGDCLVLLKNEDGKVIQVNSRPVDFVIDEKENAVATWTMQSGKRAGWSTETLSEAAALYIPLLGRGEAIGTLVYKPRSRKKLGVDRENLLSTVAKQLAISIEREIFEERAREGVRLQESERLHQTLLNSISHEMRTPLTAILGSATALQGEVSLSEGSKAPLLLQEVILASERLNRVVENLLDMSRLSSGVLQLNKEWHDVQDLIGVSIQKIERYLRGHPLKTRIEEPLNLVEMDFRLMEHVLSNLVFNSIAYTPDESEILITVHKDNNWLVISVEDQGPGIPAESLERVFEKFFRAPGTPAGGTGLGLAIAKSIVELHGGRISARNRGSTSEVSGLRVTVELPVGNPPTLQGEKNEI